MAESADRTLRSINIKLLEGHDEDAIGFPVEAPITMAKIVVANLKSKSKPANGAKSSVVEKRVRGADGQIKILRTLDIRSATFGDDLRYVFGRNVEKARRDNKRIIGTTDVVVRKG